MKLNEVYPQWSEGDGIFGTLDIYFHDELPWKDDIIHDLLTVEFYSNYGLREISPLLRAIKDKSDRDESIARIIANRYLLKWQKLYATLKFEYNPISNYDMVETEKIENERHDESVRATQADSNANSTTDGKTYGFNATTPIPDSQTVMVSESGTSGNESNEIDGTTNTERTLTRSGNIGVTTSQQMIESERELWLWNFFNEVYNDVSKVLTIPYYK